MGIHLSGGKVSQFPQGINRWIGGNAGGQATQGDIVIVEAVAIEGCELILFLLLSKFSGYCSKYSSFIIWYVWN